jgi:RimJ/RimL family protein N-acetyltransferase
MEDARVLLGWRNDELSRRFSIETAVVDEDGHMAWLRESLANPRRQLLMALEDGKEVGTVRLDHSPDHCTLSWTVAPEARGRGIGTEMVALVLRGCAETVRAIIKSDNHASIRVAERAGMVLERREGNILYYVKTAL